MSIPRDMKLRGGPFNSWGESYFDMYMSDIFSPSKLLFFSSLMLAGYFISNHPLPPKLLLPPPSKVKWYTPYESKFITKQIKDRQAPVFVLQSLHQFSLLPVGVNAWLTRWLAHLISSLRFLTLIGKNITMISYQVLPTNELRNDEWRFFGQSQRTLTIQWTNQNSNYIYLTPSTGKHVQARHDWF